MIPPQPHKIIVAKHAALVEAVQYTVACNYMYFVWQRPNGNFVDGGAIFEVTNPDLLVCTQTDWTLQGCNKYWGKRKDRFETIELSD